MSRDFHEALRDRPLLFEPVPPTARASPMRAGLFAEELVRLLRGVPRLDAVNVPELVDENHEGRPYYRSGDARDFARVVSEQIERDAIVNKVVAHLPSHDALSEWAQETVQVGVRHVVLVGGSSRYIPYPGPAVMEANRIVQPILGRHRGHLGNIAIPQRQGEARRMVAKTQAGATFFTTQILFDGEHAIEMIGEYDRLCRESKVDPAAVILSFAPITDEADAEFVRWLGADITESAERVILNGEDGGEGARSVTRAREVYRGVRAAGRDHGWSTVLGVNVEQISQRHLSTAAEMLRAFATEMASP
ncbi:MAG: mycobacterial-type methylenetetrahydrofolate reductase [Thermoplasmata archaeon]|nr:mycobacterial-type methylenetetrahydrofolate reductase [Thermoplasmata archaeon]